MSEQSLAEVHDSLSASIVALQDQIRALVHMRAVVAELIDDQRIAEQFLAEDAGLDVRDFREVRELVRAKETTVDPDIWMVDASINDKTGGAS